MKEGSHPFLILLFILLVALSACSKTPRRPKEGDVDQENENRQEEEDIKEWRRKKATVQDKETQPNTKPTRKKEINSISEKTGLKQDYSKKTRMAADYFKKTGEEAKRPVDYKKETAIGKKTPEIAKCCKKTGKKAKLIKEKDNDASKSSKERKEKMEELSRKKILSQKLREKERKGNIKNHKIKLWEELRRKKMISPKLKKNEGKRIERTKAILKQMTPREKGKELQEDKAPRTNQEENKSIETSDEKASPDGQGERQQMHKVIIYSGDQQAKYKSYENFKEEKMKKYKEPSKKHNVVKFQCKFLIL